MLSCVYTRLLGRVLILDEGRPPCGEKVTDFEGVIGTISPFQQPAYCHMLNYKLLGGDTQVVQMWFAHVGRLQLWTAC